MNAEQIIKYISEAEKKTKVKVYVRWRKGKGIWPESCKVFSGTDQIVIGDWKEIEPVLIEYADRIEDLEVECYCRNSGIPLLDIRETEARIEPGAIIREKVHIGRNAVIMMGAIINIGASVGDETMIDMGAVLGGRAIVGARCHIGAGAVLAGVIEPVRAPPVIVEDDVVVGANAVLIEGVHIGKGAVIAAGSTVISDVPAGMVAAGVPARIIKAKDSITRNKTAIAQELRNI